MYIIKLHQIAQYSEAAFEEPQLTWISNAQCADPEVFTTGSSQLNVVSCVMMDSSLGQHGIVLNLTFPKIVGSLSLSKLNYTLWQYKCEIVHLKQTHRSTLKKKKNYISIMNTSISQDTYILPLKIQL